MHSASSSGTEYERRLQNELKRYSEVVNVHDLPAIFHYWSNKHLVPRLETLGYRGAHDVYLDYLSRRCDGVAGRDAQFVSVGAGNCDTEVRLALELVAAGHTNFHFECLEINPEMLERGRTEAAGQGLAESFTFTRQDINNWQPARAYDIVIANHSLHHVVELEQLLDAIKSGLDRNGAFLINDMIGRNGHMRWPEALERLRTFWDRMPDRYKYNHQLARLELEFEDWDCSKSGFEGIRSQDILPLLLERFHFELFYGFANVIDVFVDRSFGHNFDSTAEWDMSFIDEIDAADQEWIEQGAVKPTHMIAAAVIEPVESPRIYKHLTPEFCVRMP
jgi:SAM-dependent methyltransferase